MRHFSIGAFKSQDSQFVAVEFIVGVALPVMREATWFAEFALLEFDQLERAGWPKSPDDNPILPGFGHTNRVYVSEFFTDGIRASDNGENSENVNAISHMKLPERPSCRQTPDT